MRHVVPVLPDSRSPVSQSLITLSAYRVGRISAAGEGEETEWLGHGVDMDPMPYQLIALFSQIVFDFSFTFGGDWRLLPAAHHVNKAAKKNANSRPSSPSTM